jgi:hypothetical protein
MCCTWTTGKLWKHWPRNMVIWEKGGTPSIPRLSSTRTITGRSGCVIGCARTLSSTCPPPGSTLSKCAAQFHRVWLAIK